MSSRKPCLIAFSTFVFLLSIFLFYPDVVMENHTYIEIPVPKRPQNLSKENKINTTNITIPVISTRTPCAKPAWSREWQECPPSKGAASVVVTVVQGGGLGNQVWEYLAVWGVARRYGLSPAVPRVNRQALEEVFRPDTLHIPILEDLSRYCGLPWTDVIFAHTSVLETWTQRELLNAVTLLRPGQLLLLRLYIVHTESAVPLWRDIPEELKLRPELVSHGERTLTQVRESIRQQVHDKTSNSSLADLYVSHVQYVGVHVRRTDYNAHVVFNYPGAKPASPRYFLSAMRWMRRRLRPRPVAFLVVSDDLKWCREELLVDMGEIKDVHIVGSGETSRRGEDLATLGACNHSILSYGTFGLTGAALAQGGYTLVFDTQNNTNSKEMEFVNRLPGWFAMDDAGRIRDEEVNYQLTLVKG